MAKGFMLRGQGVGVLHDRVFIGYPTEDDFKDALAKELRAHGLVFDKKEIDGVVTIVGATPRSRWVRVQETEIADADHPAAEVAKDARVEMRGILSKKDIAELFEEARKGPPGSATATQDFIAGSGTAEVINPEDVGEITPDMLQEK